MVVVIAIAVAGGAVAAAGALWLIIRKALKRNKDDEFPLDGYIVEPVPPEALPIYDKSRPLGQMEYIQKSLHERQRGILTFAMVLNMKTYVSEAMIKQALDHLAKMQPLLKMKVIMDKESEIPYFEPMDNFQVDFTSSAKTDWNQLLCDEVDNKFNLSKGPLWRVIYLPDATYDGTKKKSGGETVYPSESVLVMTFQRSIMDEPTIAEVAVIFLTFLNEMIEGESSEIETYPLLPSLDVHYTAEHVDKYWYEGMTKMLHKIPEELSIESIGEINENHHPNDIDVIKKNNNIEKKAPLFSPQELFTEMMDLETSERFIRKCVQYNVAVSAALEVAAVLAFAQNDQTKEDEAPVLIEQVIYLKPVLAASVPFNYCGNYSVDNVVDTIVPKDPEFYNTFWSLSKDVNRGMSANMANALPILYVPPPLTPEEAEEEKKMEKKLPAPPPPARGEPDEFSKIRVSSIGLIGKSSGEKVVELNGLFGHVGLRKSYGPFLGYSHAAVDNRICWTITYKKDKYSRDDAEVLMKSVSDLILKSITMNPPGPVTQTGKHESEQEKV